MHAQSKPYKNKKNNLKLPVLERLLDIYPSSCMVKRASTKYRLSRIVVTDASRCYGHELVIFIGTLSKKRMVGFVTIAP